MKVTEILVVERDLSFTRMVIEQFAGAGDVVASAHTGDEALATLERKSYDLVLLVSNLQDISGLELTRKIRKVDPEVAIVVAIARSPLESPSDVIRAGASDYVTMPVDSKEWSAVMRRCLLRLEVEREKASPDALSDNYRGFEALVGHSRALMRVLEIAAKAAPTAATVLIKGETGTGKEMLARAIHGNSHRREHPFITINCAAIPRDLLESELFGFERGAFTGAVARKKGMIEVADKGTLFLDEVGEIPMDLQAKLLRVLQNGEIQPLGTTASRKVDVRVVVATNQHLESMVAKELFRLDLYYRLSVIPLEMPPLRERREDIPDLVQHFFDAARRRYHREELVLSDAVMQLFINYAWPGNVRELENLVERVVVLAKGDQIAATDVPDLVPKPLEYDVLKRKPPQQGISLVGVEKDLLVWALDVNDGNQAKAARFLGITRKTLMYRMGKHGIQRFRDKRYRQEAS